MITITYRIVASGELRSRQAREDDFVLNNGRLYLEVWSSHFAELDLAQPQNGWIVYPD